MRQVDIILCQRWHQRIEWLKNGRQRKGNKIRVLDEEGSNIEVAPIHQDRHETVCLNHLGAPLHGNGLHDKWDVIIDAERWLIDESCTVTGRLNKVRSNISMSWPAEKSG